MSKPSIGSWPLGKYLSLGRVRIRRLWMILSKRIISRMFPFRRRIRVDSNADGDTNFP